MKLAGAPAASWKELPPVEDDARRRSRHVDLEADLGARSRVERRGIRAVVGDPPRAGRAGRDAPRIDQLRIEERRLPRLVRHQIRHSIVIPLLALRGLLNAGPVRSMRGGRGSTDEQRRQNTSRLSTNLHIDLLGVEQTTVTTGSDRDAIGAPRRNSFSDALGMPSRCPIPAPSRDRAGTSHASFRLVGRKWPSLRH